MVKFVVALSLLFTIANAGYLGAPIAYHAPVVAAPVLAAPVVKAAVPVATSYQNTYKVSGPSVPVVVKAAPLVAAPAVHYAPAPVIVKTPVIAAPLYHH